MAYKQRKRKVKKNVPEGVVHIHATFNNTVVTITDKYAWYMESATTIRIKEKRYFFILFSSL